jgi:signal transduction histidine kinase/ActR/RegA family two-component response regulator
MDARVLLDGLDAGVAAIAPDWTIAEWSFAAARLTGLPADRVLGQNFWVACPTTRGVHVERLLNDVLQDGVARSFVSPGRAPELAGKVFETRVSRGPRSHLILEFREVRSEVSPESRAAQILTAFETERRLYRQLFESLPIPALMLTLDGQILEANREGGALLGLADPRTSRGRALSLWLRAAQRPALAGALRDAVRTPQRLALSIDFAGEPARDVSAMLTRVDPEQADKVLFLALDVSRETLLQQKLLRADRMAQLGQLVSGVAHELNNPLSAIAGFAEMLAADAATPQLRESAEIIHLEAMRAGQVVQTLLDFARHRPQTRQAVDLQDVAERVVALQRSALRKVLAKVTLQFPEDLPEVMGDPQELQQVLLNAVLNAQQAVGSTGRPGAITITARRTNNHVTLLVEDTGPGVPPEILDRIFEPFFTTKGPDGTGLGLAISLGIVKAMGGRLYMHNIEGGGARLGIELPVGDPRPKAEPQAGFRPAARPLSVLVVEDERSVRRGFTLMAERLGHRVTVADSYGEARDLLVAPNSRYDAVVVDVHLDEAHTGFELFEQLLSEGRGREQRVVFTTGDSLSAQTRDALQRASRPVLRKPFKLDELREILERVAGG